MISAQMFSSVDAPVEAPKEIDDVTMIRVEDDEPRTSFPIGLPMSSAVQSKKPSKTTIEIPVLEVADPKLRIRTFRPTWEQFKDFDRYVEYMEAEGAGEAGVARIIPPVEYNPRKSGYSDSSAYNFTIEMPSSQCVASLGDKQDGAYQQVVVSIDPMSVEKFKKTAESARYCTPPHESDAELSNIFWEKITDYAAIYGEGVHGTITDPDLEFWNLNNLPSILDNAGLMEGITSSYLYFGMWKTAFAFHTEDMDLYSINLLHFGASKTWYAIPPSYAKKFEEECAKAFPKTARVCQSFLRHKTTFLSPLWLKNHGIPFDTVTQRAGEIIVTFPLGYHQGFNHGFNCAEASNFAMKRWVQYGMSASTCVCKLHDHIIDMDFFVKRYQRKDYELWRAGKNEVYRLAKKNKRRKSRKQMHPELNVHELFANPNLDRAIKDELAVDFPEKKARSK